LSHAFTVRTLGPQVIPSPLDLGHVADDDRVLVDVELHAGQRASMARAFEKAGPRETLFFDPAACRVGILTAGGLCPGTNNVIRTIVLELFHKYGVRSVLGFRFGFAGLDPASGVEPISLSLDDVRHIHGRGGTILGTSRGKHDVGTMVETLDARGVDALFVIGGDGSMRGAHAIAEEALARGRKLAVVALPKTIDNDVAWVDKTFGFDTAVAVARNAVDAAHTEALSIRNGVGLVKLMGREAGFIAAHAALASHDVDACLVPEVPFSRTRLLAWLEKRLAARGHAVVVVAEGCAKHFADLERAPKDASGNLDFGSDDLDVGAILSRDCARFGLKYIDPSYMIRGVPAAPVDAILCDDLARNAVHAAMAGKTDVLVGRWHRSFTHVPLPLVLEGKKRIDPRGDLWRAVLETTGQPDLRPTK
jgi:6-phosphofructokinase 1